MSANRDNALGNGCTNGSGADTITLPSNRMFTYSTGFNNGDDNPFTAMPFITSDITINGNGSRLYRNTSPATPDFRLLAVTNYGRLTLNDMVVANGELSFSGGAIYVSPNSSLSVIDSRITSSRAVGANGGGIYSRGGPVVLQRTLLINNSASFGGGIAGRNASLNISDSDVRNNSATVGGGIQSIVAGQIIVTNNSKIRYNTASLIGGGINDTGTTDMLISDSTVSGNTSTQRGGGLSISGSSRIRNSQISGNTAMSGAGIISFSGGIIENSTISGNVALSGNTGYDLCKDNRPNFPVPYPGYGGGILVRQNMPSFSNTTISSNQADCGGGIAIMSRQNTASLNTATISNNSAWQGGGMFIASTSLNVPRSITIETGTISENYARFGAGIHLRNSNVTIKNLTAHNNRAGFSGGGVHLYRSQDATQPTTLKMANVTLSNNTSGYYGGGFFAASRRPGQKDSSIEASNITVVGNRVTQTNNGAGIETIVPSLTLRNSIVWNTSGYDCFDSNNQLALDIDSSNILTTGTCTNNAMAVDPMLEPLDDNGGASQTHALTRNSPALDAGVRAVCASSLVSNLDQTGKTRPIGDDCDIGAFESPFGQSTGFFVIPLPNGSSVTVPL